MKCCVVSRNNPKVFNVYHTSLTVLPLPISERHKSVENLVVENCDKNSFVHDLTAYITKRPDDITVLVGESIQLDVEYVGDPEPTVNWMRAVSLWHRKQNEYSTGLDINKRTNSTRVQYANACMFLFCVCYAKQNVLFQYLTRAPRKKKTLKPAFSWVVFRVITWHCLSKIFFVCFNWTLIVHVRRWKWLVSSLSCFVDKKQLSRLILSPRIKSSRPKEHVTMKNYDDKSNEIAFYGH